MVVYILIATIWAFKNAMAHGPVYFGLKALEPI